MTESYDWVLKTILSCTNDWHLRCCRTLIDLYGQQYPEAQIFTGNLIERYNEKEALIMV